MAIVERSVYGCYGPWWAPISAEPDGGLPAYGEVLEVGALAQFNQSLTFASGEAYGNNKLQIQRRKFVSGTVDAQVVGMRPEVTRAMYGAGGAGTQVVFSEGDESPMGGLTYYKTIATSEGKDIFEAHFYPKTQATRGNDNASTATNSLAFQNKGFSVTIFGPNNKDYEYTEEFETEEEAEAWCVEQLGGGSGG